MADELEALVGRVADEVVRQLGPLLRPAGGSEAEYLTLRQVAALTGFGYDFVRDAVARGDLPAALKGRSWRVRAADARAWVDRGRGPAPPPARAALRAKVSRLMPGLGR